MKRKIAIPLLVMLTLAACGRRNETVSPTVSAEQTQQTQEIQITEAETQTFDPASEPEFTGVYRHTRSEEIAGKVMDKNSYIVLNDDNTGCWIAQDIGTLTWDASQLMLTIGASYDIALTQENGTVNLLVYEFQDENGEWIPTVYEKIEELPAEIETMLAES